MSALRRRVASLDGEGGFTLVELMVVIAVSTIIIGMATNSVITSLQAQRRQMAQLEALNGAKIALERMTRDVRAANPVEDARADAIEVSVERGGVVQPVTFMLEPVAGGTRRLVWCQTSMAACTGSSVRPLLEDLSADAGYALLRYFDGDGVEVAAPVDAADIPSVRMVRIGLRVEVPEHTQPILLDNDIVLRNWRP